VGETVGEPENSLFAFASAPTGNVLRAGLLPDVLSGTRTPVPGALMLKLVLPIAALGGIVEIATGGTPEIVIFGPLKSATLGLSLLLIVKNATPSGFVFFSL
jgi:hypothetical protein